MKRKICVVTGTRAEYGLLYWLMREIERDEDLVLQVVVTGMHLSPEFGETYKIIEQDGFPIADKIEILLSSDTAVGMAKSVGLAVMGFAESFKNLQPDIVVLLGDRFEMLAAAQTALLMRIPIAHIHGGELSEGAVDEAIRHSITKMAQYHFVAAEPYRRRVIQLGEHPDRVYNVGAPGLDAISRMDLMSKSELERDLGWSLGDTTFLVTYHPVTLQSEDPVVTVQELLAALDAFPEAHVLITMPNADAGGRSVARLLGAYASRCPERVLAVASLGQQRYLSALKLADVVIGNSSSGIIEAPFLGTPTVNIGDRQAGRLRARSVIDCPGERAIIVEAIRKALTPEFQALAANVETPYGKGDASSKIKELLKTVPLDGVVAKKFFDLPLDP
ncbi:MAG: UDP-N-acetylglucosamine 2-epimerase (hydrolyzing) [Alicyclobacillus macrosporangiidus]|uniref:UDP-N-acetylglucosamine 2-epimerase n=1 Tax=Alicyclobacillus macrosporangiidus TaxID=392015 RepID=UPI0026F1002C|nr:UDP-N-acetylglucosamine 2-epimerase [Alicyclobacillus macrosporangiidus]MCL6598711.1 UDP-N-acetylglucosamine 2-epimerase (hydrolyzing) [Alicyclobacillus macrosporangiidus]